MPTYDALDNEAVWRNEFVPDEIVYLTRNLRNFWELRATALGAKGNNKHLRGYHRSRAWILGSKFATDKVYSVVETRGNREGGNPNWVCAIDISLPISRLVPVCDRLDRAVRAGLLEKVTEWYGNKDGDKRVDGYNNILNRAATSDDSHLWHLHISFDRGRAGENHNDLFLILTGQASIPPRPTTPPNDVNDQEWTEKMLRNAPLVKMGATGFWVRTIQGLLVARGHRVDVDGDFRDKTYAAVKAVQRQYKAESVDGQVGPETWTILFTGADGV